MDYKERKVFTLTELANSLKSIIEKNYTSSYWIKAEIAKINHYPRSGHAYPELVEKVDDKVFAQFRSIIWANSFISINESFKKITGEPLKDGAEILFRASVNFHAVYGLSLIIHEVEPSFTLGQMALEKAKTIEKLKEKNLFNKNKSIKFPMLPKRIAVISIETSKGYNDYINIINNFQPGFVINNKLFPAILQGDQAVKTIIQQLKKIKKIATYFDAVAIIRGGGGDIGLNCYNNYELAKEIACFPLAVVTGIGHSTNETVAEMVSYKNKITPTDVAYFFLGHFESFSQRVKDAKQKIVSLTERILSFENQKQSHLHKTLSDRTKSICNNQENYISGIRKSLKHLSLNLISQEQTNLSNKSNKLSASHLKSNLQQNAKLEGIKSKLESSVAKNIRAQTDKISFLSNHIKLSDPINILKKGYSISMVNGEVIKSAKHLSAGQKITTRLLKETIESTINKIEKS